jgi:hypothetical protein
MGDVYLAEDEKLHRKVALKVLPQATANQPDRLNRFRREVESVAALSHPNIVTIFSVEEEEGVHFLTMELIDGTTLDKVIPAGGLPSERAIALAVPMADALSYDEPVALKRSWASSRKGFRVRHCLASADDQFTRLLIVPATTGNVVLVPFGSQSRMGGVRHKRSARRVTARKNPYIARRRRSRVSPASLVRQYLPTLMTDVETTAKPNTTISTVAKSRSRRGARRSGAENSLGYSVNPTALT